MQGSLLKYGARRLIRENAPKIILISVLFVIMTTVMSELEFRLPGISNAYQRYMALVLEGQFPNLSIFTTHFRPSGAVLAVMLYLLRPVAAAGMASYCLKTTVEQSGDYKDLLNGFNYFIKILLIFLVTTLFTFLWLMLFIAPGFVALYRYRQAYYILLEAPEKGALQCIRESKRMMHGAKLELFLLDLSFIGWYLLDLMVVILIPTPFALPLISIWLTPYMGLTHAAFYHKLVGKLAV